MRNCGKSSDESGKRSVTTSTGTESATELYCFGAGGIGQNRPYYPASLRLLCTVEHPEEILSITFTRKAAGEMASRIHSALHSAAYEPRPSDDYEAQTWDLAAQAVARSAELGWNLLEMPGRLRIQTIDGFCRYIASQFALETKLGALPEPSENPQVLYELAARSLLDKD